MRIKTTLIDSALDGKFPSQGDGAAGNPLENVDGLIVTFNPDVTRFSRVLDSAANQLHEIVIIDNDSKNIGDIEQIVTPVKNVTLIKNKTNTGLAAALNQGFSYLLSRKYANGWILTLDQDTVLTRYAVREVLTSLMAQSGFKDVGIVSLSYGRKNKKTFREIHHAITSGSLIRADILGNIKTREEFFIDNIDLDFSYRVRQIGYKILAYKEKLASHELGKTAFKGAIKFVEYEASSRYYYIVRNSTVLYLEGKLPLRYYLSQILANSFKIILLEGFSPFVRALMYGVNDGVKRRLGPSKRFQLK
jgi:rhamnosyltransferase